VLAADVGAGQPEIVAQEIGEMSARLDLAGEDAAIDAQADGFGGHGLLFTADLSQTAIRSWIDGRLS